MENKNLHLFRVTYKKYNKEENKYKKEADIIAADFVEAAEKIKKILNETGEDYYTIYSVKYIGDCNL